MTDMGYPRRPGKGTVEGGAFVVVGARESRVQGEGRQETDTLWQPEERSVDSDHQADRAWVLSVQRKLYQWSRQNPDEPYRELWNWMTDLRSLRRAWRVVSQNKGKRTPGIDGETVGSIRRGQGEGAFLDAVRQELRSGQYRPSPC
jgi:RNA-directed DNA polymerase